jgi:hypothetical protein
MQRLVSHRRALCLALTLTALLIGLIPLPAVKAQSGPITAAPIPILYRWRVSNSNLGYMLHQSLAAGQNLGYANEGSVFQTFFPSSQRAGIINPQPPGYTPAPGNPLIPIYQWRVVQSGRTYYYYSGPGFGGGPGYYYEGQLGWVLPPNFQSATDINGRQVRGAAINYYYSQRYGYWYTSQRPDLPGLPGGVCFPDTCNAATTSYRFHGVGFQLPVWDTAFENPPEFAFDPPPPPPICDGDQEQACYDIGGSWDSINCRCTIIRESDPCFDCPLPLIK